MVYSLVAWRDGLSEKRMISWQDSHAGAPRQKEPNSRSRLTEQCSERGTEACSNSGRLIGKAENSRPEKCGINPVHRKSASLALLFRDSASKKCFILVQILTKSITMLDGFSGFPLVNGIPRGQSFVYFMRMQQPGSAFASVPQPKTASTVGPVLGGFSDDATATVVSEKKTPLQGGIVRTDSIREFSDGSRRTGIHHKMPDGSVKFESERRSLPDADGFQKVRVWERTTAPDGTQSGNFRVFRVPAGMQVNWDSAQAQQFLLTSIDNALSAEGSFATSPSSDLPDPVPENDVRREDALPPTPRRRPVIPLAP